MLRDPKGKVITSARIRAIRYRAHVEGGRPPQSIFLKPPAVAIQKACNASPEREGAHYINDAGFEVCAFCGVSRGQHSLVRSGPKKKVAA